MSLWAEYLSEREGKEVIEDDDSLISYFIEGEVCCIGEIYIKKEKRHGPKGREIFKKVCDIARAAKCKEVYGTVSPQDRNAVRNITIQLAIGFTLKEQVNGLYIFSMPL